METLIEENGTVLFQIEFEPGDYDFTATFTVFEVISWTVEASKICETESYLRGYVKGDSSCHFWFGDDDGYIRFSGKEGIEKHKKVMDAIWNICTKKIKHFNRA
jgi:hypothetical protein